MFLVGGGEKSPPFCCLKAYRKSHLKLSDGFFYDEKTRSGFTQNRAEFAVYLAFFFSFVPLLPLSSEMPIRYSMETSKNLDNATSVL